MENKDNKLRDACQLALETMKKLKQPEFEETINKLEYCIGSFDYDKNPSGLREYGSKALDLLVKLKEKNPRKVQKTLIKKLEDTLS